MSKKVLLYELEIFTLNRVKLTHLIFFFMLEFEYIWQDNFKYRWTQIPWR